MLWLPFARVCFLPGASSFSGIGTISKHLRSVNIIDALAWYGLGPRRAGALILRQFLPGISAMISPCIFNATGISQANYFA
jgi:CHASE2 domain-containing sensor protein